MEKMYIKTIQLTLENNPTTWDESQFNNATDNNPIVGYLLSNKSGDKLSLNLYLLPPHCLYEDSLDSIQITYSQLKIVFLQWIEQLILTPHSFQFRNPPLDLWLETRLNWINSLCVKIHHRYGTDVSEALSTAYMTILKLHRKGNIYIGNLHYLSIAIHTAIKAEHAYMRNRLTGAHPDAIHLDASPGEFNLAIDNDVTSFHEIITVYDWEADIEKRAHEIYELLEEDLAEEFTPREIDLIKRGPAFMTKPLYNKLLKWQKERSYEDYL